MGPFKRTKIVATLGPATDSLEAIRALAEAIGARVAVLYTDPLDDRVRSYLDLLDHNRKALCP